MATSGLDILNALKAEKQKTASARENNRNISIRRHQVSTNAPAIGRLHIEFPRDIPEQSLDPFERFLHKITEGTEPEHKDIRRIDGQTFQIDLKSFKHMYTELEWIIDEVKRNCSFGRTVEVDGHWEKYGD